MRAHRAAQRRELSDAERDILLPGTLEQLEFIRQQWIDVREIAQRPNVHAELAFALAPLLPPMPGADPDASARAYFTEMAHQAQQMIDNVDEVLRARPANPDVLSAWAWLSRAWSAASVVLRNRRLLFWKKLRSFVTLRNSQTGEIIAKPLPQVEWIVFPFDTIVDEACRVAEAIQHNVAIGKPSCAGRERRCSSMRPPAALRRQHDGRYGRRSC